MKTIKIIFLLFLLTLVYGCSKPQTEHEDMAPKEAAEALKRANEQVELAKKANEELQKAKDAVEMVRLEGSYAGTFTVMYTYGFEKKSWATVVKLEKGNYFCSGNSGDTYPFGGSGKFSIHGNKITFSDENFWFAIGDWNLILNGEYGYTFEGAKLKFAAYKGDVGYYEYDLERE